MIGMKAGYTAEQRNVLYGQMAYETGNFTSALYKTANNVCGMQVATKRPQRRSGTATAEGRKNMYAKYSSPFWGVYDLYVYLGYVGIPKTSDPAVYTALLKAKGYFEGDSVSYAKGIAVYMQGVKKTKTVWPYVFSFCFLCFSVCLIFFRKALDSINRFRYSRVKSIKVFKRW